MLAKFVMITGALAALILAPSKRAQSTAQPQDIVLAGCYRIAVGAWSRPLGVNAGFHAVPEKIRLDTAPASRGGWKVSPDIAYPYPSRFTGYPRWTVMGDSVEIGWSNGFQPTTVRLGRHRGAALRGIAIVQSDANEYGTSLPRAEVVARRIKCTSKP